MYVTSENSNAKPFENALDGRADTFWESRGTLGGTTREIYIGFYRPSSKPNTNLTFRRILYQLFNSDIGWWKHIKIVGTKCSEEFSNVLKEFTNEERFTYQADLDLGSEQCYKSIRIEVTSASQNKVAASRIEFWREDSVLTEARKLFTDGTLSEFSNEYKDPQKVQEFITSVNNHPCPYLFSEYIYAINEIRNDPEGVKKSVQTIECRPTHNAYFNFDHNTNQPSGKYMLSGERILQRTQMIEPI
ncbi:hypothetical protein TVAG_289580 [Trichomonas vaginalis G3]|uniref:Uncharacterized protein n=1 Tax=Trichomonas vaginalis (strain ATCC PRA-98 / G3) TaxID=412133 RepID=A2G9Y1_TRIV3|nr:hypothetical protein TVAGG3_0187150 [Trichomonas vaginalis G3]EAX86039.1 hypothetical protein TVAG_289580 [Trichomonas vaginalis G3]KAI5549721.1 hypothetical protein TVAGG3_0187150 [Trichomonas vaginalis G3]|eukprot:XP_001298969.1 hypothetical protein [Trichomonas vaginalis G3]